MLTLVILTLLGPCALRQTQRLQIIPFPSAGAALKVALLHTLGLGLLAFALFGRGLVSFVSLRSTQWWGSTNDNMRQTKHKHGTEFETHSNKFAGYILFSIKVHVVFRALGDPPTHPPWHCQALQAQQQLSWRRPPHRELPPVPRWNSDRHTNSIFLQHLSCNMFQESILSRNTFQSDVATFCK